MTTPLCDFPDCGRPAHALGLCVSHRTQQRRGKALSPLRAYQSQTERASGCSFPGCDRVHRAKGLCSSHYDQQLRGRPLRALAPYVSRTRPQSREGTCEGPECDRPIAHRRLCHAHVKQQDRGKPLTPIRAPQPKQARAPRPKRARKPKSVPRARKVAPKPEPVEPRTDWTVLLHQPKPKPVSRRSMSPLESRFIETQPLTVTPAMHRRAAHVARSLGWDDDLLTMLGINQEQAS